ncbi:hypothetical protein Barb4_02952 [Bacteroidales bacterium Barb4]|nr:hypothetical protein Barb4_02952 [Bacteroidales bacterium Barb4]
MGNDIHIAVLSAIENKNYTYSGLAINPTGDGALNIRTDLTEGTDYRVVYSSANLIDANPKITVSIQGLGTWGETAPIGTFSIDPVDFYSDNLTIEVPAYTLLYNEDPNDALVSIKEKVVVKLGGVALPLEDFDIITGLITNRTQATVEVKPDAGNGNFTKGTRTVITDIKAYTGNETIAAPVAFASYANGVLTLTNLDGKIVTIASLNGKIIARFAVSGDRVEKAIDLAQGIYILKAGKTATKFIVR